MNHQQFETILQQALCPEVDAADTIVRPRPPRKGHFMNTRKFFTKLCAAAAIMALLVTTAYAADALNIRTLVSGGSSRTYPTVAQAEEAAGFQMADLDTFANGYRFDHAQIQNVRGLDDKDQTRLTYKEISVTLKNSAGEKLTLSAYPHHDSLKASDTAPNQTRKLGDVTLEYRHHHYKFMPAEYIPTPEDQLWLQQPGNYMSYGSDAPRESEVAFLNWEQDGICYILMDSDGSERADSLFNMAEELILTGN